MSTTLASRGKIAAALAWEFWARGWVGIVLAPLGAMALPACIFTLLSWQDGVVFAYLGNVFQFAFYWTTLLMLASSVLTALGDPRHRYTLPASSFLIIATLMACAALSVLVQSAVVTASLNVLFDVGWPIWGPALLAAVLVALCQAVLWSTSNSPGLQVLACAVTAALLGAGLKLWGPPALTMMTMFSDLGAAGVASFALALVACAVVSAHGFSTVRRGAVFDLKAAADWFSRVVSFGAGARRPAFSSPQSAQFWLEWTQRGFALPLAITLAGIVLVVLALFLPAPERPDVLGAFFALGLAPLPVIGIFFGSRSITGDFGNFNGSRPMSDAQLAAAVLKSATLSLILSTTIWAALFALIALVAGEHRETTKLYKTTYDIGLVALTARLGLTWLAVWGAVGLVSALTLSGRRLIAAVLPLAFGLWIVGMLIRLCLPAGELRATITQAYTIACFSACFLAVGLTFIASWRRRLIFMPTLLLAALVVLAAVVLAHFSGLTANSREALALALGCLLIPTPLAAAPLAANVNRHR